MRKHFQVLLSEYRALRFLDGGAPRLVQQWVFRFEPLGFWDGAPEMPLSDWPGAACPWRRVRSGLEAVARQAKLRLLVPALRRALEAATRSSQQHQARLRRDLLLERPEDGLQQGWTLTELLFICLSPADAPQLRIDWVVV